MVIAALQLQDIPAALSCERCEDDLATFLDLEADEGSMAAAQRLPAVWWHLWACTDCAEVYGRVRRVMWAEEASLRPDIVVRRLLRVARSFLHIALPQLSPQRGGTHGDPADDIVLAIQEKSEPHFSVSVRRVEKDLWRFTVKVAPPPSGWVLFSLGEACFRAPFNAQGAAVVPDVPDALLAEPDGPDLDISIEELPGAPGDREPT